MSQKRKTPAIYRLSKDTGELFVLLPHEPGDPDGVTCVMFGLCPKFMPVDPREVMKTTEPGSKNGLIPRVRKALLDQMKGLELEEAGRLPAGHDDVRREQAALYAEFPRIRSMYQPRR